MPDERWIILLGAGAIVVLALATMAAMHERHYRERRLHLGAARLRALELRLEAVEAILAEDRLT